MNILKISLSALAVCALLFAASCGGKKTEDKTMDSEEKIPAETTVESEKTAEPEEETSSRKPGENPYDFPVLASSEAKPGEFVLAPADGMLEKAFEKKNQTVIYYAAKVEKPGDAESELKSLPGSVFKSPNSMIIPLGTGAEAKKGDILLTWWQTGSGLQRAIVTDASNPKEPMVRYLDLKFDNPAKRDGKPIAQQDYKLKPNSFKVITEPMTAGTTVMVDDKGKKKHYKMLSKVDGKVLVHAFASKIEVVDASACRAIPLVPDVKAGDKVMIPTLGTFKDAVVKSVDALNGRVTVTFMFGGKEKEEAIAFGDVLKAE